MKKIVTIGGGTGSFVLLSGLKKYPVYLSAIVSMVDDGGSTGVLRDELGVLPPGDVRQCLVALSDSSEKMRELMNYRFEKGGLKGHSFGNLLLSALEKINKGFLKGVEEASKILNVKGEVIPVTDSDVNLCIELKNSKVLKGEHQINLNFEIEKIGIKKIYLTPKARPNKKAIQRIKEADMIVIGPGNFYCSILPNFFVKGISEAICQSKAIVVFNCNLVNKRGHTEKFSLDDYVETMNKFLGKERINFVTFNSLKPPQRLIKKYQKQKEFLVPFIKEARTERNYKIILTPLLNTKAPKFSKVDTLVKQRSFIRHDPDKLAKVLMFLLELEENKNFIKAII
jgi:uncharacterized cofD-like protein